MAVEYAPDTKLTKEDKAELLKKLRDPLWRIRNLYRITDKKGKEIQFKPNWAQEQLIHAYYVTGIMRIIVLKARRLGFSTLIDVMIFDAVYWAEEALQASIIDQTQPDASEKLRTKVKFAHEKLPDFMREPLRKANEKQVEFAQGGTVNAGKNARGGTNQFIHVSEWGPIAHTDPKRSEEIKTGALPSADQGAIFVESTFKGGKGGHFYELIKNAMEVPVELKTTKDFHFMFFAWFRDPTNTLDGDPKVIDPETSKYLDQKERELKIKFTPGQRIFYMVTKREQGIFMFREYPTTVEEAFKAPVEGAIYGELISKIRSRGQIIDFIWDRSYPVFAVFDIGWNDSTSVFLFQIVGRDIHVIWHHRERHLTAAQIWKKIGETEIPIYGIFLPHDAKNKNAGGGLSYKDEIEKAGADNITVLPQPKDKWAGINAARDLLARCWIHRTHCARGIESLEAYHTKDSSSGGTITKDPVHDWSSHDADAFRYLAESVTMGLVKTKQGRKVDMLRPLAPDGSVVDVDLVRDARRTRRQRGKARGGIRL